MIRNVVTVCDGAGLTGGTEKVAITSAMELATRGYRSIYFAGEGDLYPGFEAAGVEASTLGLSDAYHTESKRELLSRFFWNGSAGEKFSQMLAEKKLDPKETVIHFHGFRRVLSGAVVEAAVGSGFKLVFTLHDFGLACPNTSFFNFPNQQICTLKPMSMACHLSQCTHSGLPMKMMQMGRAWKLRMSHMVDKFDHFIYVSNFSRDILLPFIPAKIGQTVLYNPVSDSQEPIADCGESDVFSFVGRLSPEKGGLLFAEAAKQAGVRCQFIGKGGEEEKIRNANPDAVFTGWVTAEDVEAKVRGSRAVVMPSLWYETAGLSVIEAVSRGIPVIVSDKCASVEYMTHERSGLTFASGDVDSLAQALGQMSAGKARTLGANAYKDYWKSPLTTEKYMNGLLDVYAKALSS
jgi:glycosyltransferase involved in cell wall biosynthesis